MDNGFGNDPHSERGHACPKNVFGYTDYRQVQLVEAVFVSRRGAQLEDMGVTGSFDLAHLRAIHRFLFRDVFPWAGEFRVVNISKGNSTFGPAVHIAGALLDALEKLKGEGLLVGLGSAELARRAAFYLGEINAIHPFREGNGRAQREFIRQLSVNASRPLSWAGFSQEAMVHASIASHMVGDNSALAAMLEAALDSTRALEGG